MTRHENNLIILRKLIKSFNNVHILSQKLAYSIERNAFMHFNGLEEILEEVVFANSFHKASELTENELEQIFLKVIKKLDDDEDYDADYEF